MTTISTDPAVNKNARYPLKKPTPAELNGPVDIYGTVIFDLVPDKATGTLSLEITEVGGDEDSPDRLVGKALDNERYIRVPVGKTVQIDFLLGGNWKWTFPDKADGVTLADQGNYLRYWMVDKGNPKMRRIRIIPSGNNPIQTSAADNGANDEKFNLEVVIKQAFGKPLAIEIDPITKNPPPGDGRLAPVNEPGALL